MGWCNRFSVFVVAPAATVVVLDSNDGDDDDDIKRPSDERYY